MSDTTKRTGSSASNSSNAAPASGAVVWSKFEELNRHATRSYVGYVAEVTNGTSDMGECHRKAYSGYVSATQSLYKDFNDRLSAAWQSYMEALKNAWTAGDVQERCRQSYEAYLNVLAEMTGARGTRHEEAYVKLLSTIQESLRSDNPQAAIAKAVQEYLAELQEIFKKQEAIARAGKAAEEYLNSLKELQQRGQSQTAEAHQTYLSSLKAAWDQADVDRALQNTFKEYAETLQQAWTDFQKLYQDSAARATDEIRQACKEAGLIT